MLENCKLRFRYLLTTDEIIETAVQAAERSSDRRVDAWTHGVRAARARQPQYPRVAAESVLDRKPEHVHQTSRAVPKVCGVGAGRIGGGVFRGRTECAVSGDRRQSEAAASEDVRIGDSRRRSGSRAHGPKRRQSAVLPAAAGSGQARPGCRCCTTLPSTCLAIRWFARRAMPRAASIRRASIRCLSAIFCCRSS